MKILFVKFVASLCLIYSSISNAYIEDYEIRSSINNLQNQLDDLSSNDYASVMVEFNSHYPKGKFHNNWLSYQGYGSSGKIQCENEGTKDTSLVIDIYADEEMTKKDGKKMVQMRIMNKFFLDNKNINIQLRVDDKTIYEDRGSYFGLSTYIFAVPFTVIEEAKKGKFLRVRVDTGHEEIFKFSLSGFTAAYNRGVKLAKEKSEDKDFFK